MKNVFNNLFAAYVKNSIVAGIFFMPIVVFSDREWVIDDTIAFVMFGWFLGWLLSALFLAGTVVTKDAVKTLNDKE
jgi:hypothetical protein